MKILFGDMCIYLHTYRQINFVYYSDIALISLCFCDILFSIEQWSIIHIGGISTFIAHTATSKGGKR